MEREREREKMFERVREKERQINEILLNSQFPRKLLSCDQKRGKRKTQIISNAEFKPSSSSSEWL